MSPAPARTQGEWLLARLGLWIIPHLSRPAVLRLARGVGRAAYALSGHLRRVGLANLQLAFGNSLSAAQAKTILRTSFQTFALTLLDTFWFSHDMKARLSRYVVLDGSAAPFLQDKPQICVTAHLGNWEVLGLAVAERGFPLASVAAPIANPGVDRVFNRLREMSGQKVIPQQGAVRELIKILRQGKKIALLLDQNTKPAEGGIFVDFFGLPVPVSSAGAALAERTDAEIVMGFCLPQPDGSYRGHLRALLSPTPLPGEDKKQALTRLTQEITRQIEAEIRSNPGNWLWMYKRWKHVPPERSRQEYPFYAKNLPVNPAA